MYEASLRYSVARACHLRRGRALAITPVTEDAVNRLKKALPKCDVKQ
jgi:hypothetical protein